MSPNTKIKENNYKKLKQHINRNSFKIRTRLKVADLC